MSFLAAVGFLTRVPVPVGRLEPTGLARAVAWFPVVGTLIGLAIAGAYAAMLVLLPNQVAAVAAVAAGILITGAFHEDGLADTIDAIGGGRSADDVRRILKDPRLGSYGVLAMTVTVLVRSSALAAMDAWSALAMVTCAHAVARAVAVLVMRTAPVAAGEGLGASYAASLGGWHWAPAIASGALIGGLAAGVWVLPALALGGVAAAVVARPAISRIGGITGDVLGACEQVAECLIFVLGAAIVTGGWPPAAWWR